MEPPVVVVELVQVDDDAARGAAAELRMDSTQRRREPARRSKARG
jgi:hypothetical protein